MQTQNSFRRGLIDGIPICIGYLSVSFAFGIMATELGLSLLEAVIISMTNLTSAGQLAGAPIIAASGSLAELALTQLVINMRYALMSVSLSQKLSDNLPLRSRFLIAFGNTDEIFAVSYSNKGQIGKRYFYGLMLTPWIGWSTGTALGAAAGAVLPAIIASSLGVAIYAMLVAVVVPVAKEHLPTALCALCSVAIACVFKYLPVLSVFAQKYAGFVIIISAVSASTLFAVLCPIKAVKEVEDR